jgi:predicted Fe-S protein YdhL (DUF1289 family)
MAAHIRTPCIKVCFVDDDSGLCLGCFRDMDEIAGWSGLTETQRDRILADLPARRGRIAPEKLGAA